MYIAFYILIIYFPILLSLFMVNETFWGLVGSAGVIAGSAVALLLEMRKSRGQVRHMLNFLKNSTFSKIDEKTAVLYSYANDVKNWRNKGIDGNIMQSQIVEDMLSIGRVSNNMGLEQWREILKVSDLLIQAMKKEGFDTKEIEYTYQALK
jgi:hypothetical protein